MKRIKKQIKKIKTSITGLAKLDKLFTKQFKFQEKQTFLSNKLNVQLKF